MTTTGTSNFGYNTENDELIREAFERCGIDSSLLSAVQGLSAIRSMNLMFTEWVNRGINLFAVDMQQIILVPGISSYDIPADTARILQVVVEGQLGTAGDQDLLITAISRAEYFALPEKQQQNQRPTQYYLERTAKPVMYVWPVPQDSTYRIKYYRLRMSQDVGKLTNTPDVSNRWLDAICAGLAARLATKYAPDRQSLLQGQAGEAFDTASTEDVEHVTFRIAPDMSGYYQ